MTPKVTVIPQTGEIVESEVYARIDDSDRVLVDPGEYQLRFQHHETGVMFGKSPKIVLRFHVLTMGPYFGKPLQRYYNAARLIGRTGRNGQFKVHRNSDFLREYLTLFHGVQRLDRIPMGQFGKHIIVGRVRTVEFSEKQKRLPKQLKYSVVAELLRIEE